MVALGGVLGMMELMRQYLGLLPGDVELVSRVARNPDNPEEIMIVLCIGDGNPVALRPIEVRCMVAHLLDRAGMPPEVLASADNLASFAGALTQVVDQAEALRPSRLH